MQKNLKTAFFVSTLQVDNVKSVLRKELHQTVVEPTSPNALLSGSDVLFTGREFFVGISQWTNTEGAVAVAATWPEYPCTPVKASFYSNNLANSWKNFVSS